MAFAYIVAMEKFNHCLRLAVALISGLFLATSAHAEIKRFYTLGAGWRLAENDRFFTDQVQSVANQIDALELAPVNVNVLVEPVANGASFDYGSVIHIPRILRFDGEYGSTYTKMTIDVLTVFAHEYGHAIFGHFIKQKFPNYAELSRLKNEMSDIGLQLIRSDLDENTRTTYQNRLSELKVATEGNRDLIKIAHQVSPYSELYSDALAVFLHGRSSIYQALSYDEMRDHYRDYVETRDFNLQHDAGTWTRTDPHAMFSPLRSVIGSESCWPNGANEQKARLQQLRQVLMDHLEAKVAAGEMPSPRDNQALIEAFQRFCR